MNKKNIIILAIWTIAGYLCFYLSTRLFTLISMSYLHAFVDMVKEFTAQPFKNFFLYLFSYAIEAVAVFIIVLILSRTFGLKALWFIGFIIGSIAVKLVLSIQNLLLVCEQYSEIPTWELKPFITIIVISVLLIPGLGLLGGFYGNAIRKKKELAVKP